MARGGKIRVGAWVDPAPFRGLVVPAATAGVAWAAAMLYEVIADATERLELLLTRREWAFYGAALGAAASDLDPEIDWDGYSLERLAGSNTETPAAAARYLAPPTAESMPAAQRSLPRGLAGALSSARSMISAAPRPLR